LKQLLGKVTYLNSGDWVEHLTALEYSQNEWKIFEYNEKNFPTVSTKDIKTPINVVTDNINLYINSLPFKNTYHENFYACRQRVTGISAEPWRYFHFCNVYGDVDIFLSGSTAACS